MNRVAVFQSIRQSLQDDDAHTVAADRTLSLGIERAAMPVWRTNSPLLIEIPRLERNGDRHTAGHGDITLVIQKTLTSLTDGNQRGRAGGLDNDAGPLEVKVIREARGEEIFVRPEGSADLAMIKQVAEQVAVGAQAGVHANGSVVHRGITAGVFQSLPAAFQKDALLRIHHFRFFGCVAKEGGVKQVHIFQHRLGFYVLGMVQ